MPTRYAAIRRSVSSAKRHAAPRWLAAATRVACGGLVSVFLLATVPAQAQNAQQTKMTTCNKDATGKTGDDRKSFMKSCLSNTPKPMSRQDVMRDCNKQATGKKGDDRKSFMKTCLSNKS